MAVPLTPGQHVLDRSQSLASAMETAWLLERSLARGASVFLVRPLWWTHALPTTTQPGVVWGILTTCN